MFDYVTFYSEELENLPEAEEQAQCPHCLEVHPIIWGEVKGKPSHLLGAVKCDGKTWLVAVGGKLLIPPKAVVA